MVSLTLYKIRYGIDFAKKERKLNHGVSLVWNKIKVEGLREG